MSLAPASALGFCRTTTVRQTSPRECQERGVPVAWAGGCVGYRVDPRLLPPGVSFEQLRSAFRTAARRWESVICDTRTGAGPSIAFVELPGVAEPVGFFRNQTNHNTFAFRDTWPADDDHDVRAIAVTLVRFNPRTGVILDADMEFNLRGFEFTFDPQPVTDARHLPTVILHELGHVLGLAHSPVPTAVMWSEKVGARDALTLDDAQGVCTVYPPGRVATCEHEPVVHNDLGGAGWYCATRPGARSGRAWAAWAALVAAWVARWRRRGRWRMGGGIESE